MDLLGLDLDVNLRFAAGRMVLYYIEPRNMRALGQRAYSLLRPSMDSPELTPHRLARWLSMWVTCLRYAKEERQAKLAEAQMRALAEAHNLRDILFWMGFIEVNRSLPTRNVALAERGLAVAEALDGPIGIGRTGADRGPEDADRAHEGAGRPRSVPRVARVDLFARAGSAQGTCRPFTSSTKRRRG